MRELDELLLGYLDSRYDLASDEEKAAFSALLDLSDPDLIAYLLQQRPPRADLVNVVDNILSRTEH